MDAGELNPEYISLVLPHHLVAGLNSTKSQATFKLYSRLNLVLVEANARALLSRTGAYGNGSDPDPNNHKPQLPKNPITNKHVSRACASGIMSQTTSNFHLATNTSLPTRLKKNILNPIVARDHIAIVSATAVPEVTAWDRDKESEEMSKAAGDHPDQLFAKPSAGRGKERKHEANDVKCSELGWLCIPLVVESYGAWGKEAMESFSSLASRLAITSSRPKSAVLSELYGRLNLNLNSTTRGMTNSAHFASLAVCFLSSAASDRSREHGAHCDPYEMSKSSHHFTAVWNSLVQDESLAQWRVLLKAMMQHA
eukprot:Em0008g472a